MKNIDFIVTKSIAVIGMGYQLDGPECSIMLVSQLMYASSRAFLSIKIRGLCLTLSARRWARLLLLLWLQQVFWAKFMNCVLIGELVA